MAYTKTIWVNGEEPAINSTNLNKIEGGIYDNRADIDRIDSEPKIVLVSDVTLDQADWVDDTSTSGYWYNEVTDTGVSVDTVIDFAVHLSSYETALNFNMTNIVQSFNGFYRFYSAYEPDADIVVDVKKVD